MKVLIPHFDILGPIIIRVETDRNEFLWPNVYNCKGLSAHSRRIQSHLLDAPIGKDVNENIRKVTGNHLTVSRNQK